MKVSEYCSQIHVFINAEKSSGITLSKKGYLLNKGAPHHIILDNKFPKRYMGFPEKCWTMAKKHAFFLLDITRRIPHCPTPLHPIVCVWKGYKTIFKTLVFSYCVLDVWSRSAEDHSVVRLMVQSYAHKYILLCSVEHILKYMCLEIKSLVNVLWIAPLLQRLETDTQNLLTSLIE